VNLESLKQQAARQALEHVQSGMTLGLGSGSTATYFIQALGEKLKTGELKDIVGVPSSKRSETLARELGIALEELSPSGVDIAIDGMDEVDPQLNAIKGLGGAQTREKIVASSAKLFILIGDETKTVKQLGEKAPIPVEVVPFGYKATIAKLAALGTRPEQRMGTEKGKTGPDKMGGEPFITDNGNYIFHCFVTPPIDAQTLAVTMANIPGVLEHGLFLGMAKIAYVATSKEVVKMEK
jgi:ribose 5-phosphate isomerase A